MLENVLSLSLDSRYSPGRYASPDGLDSLFASKNRILRQKLNVWALMLSERLSLHAEQLDRIHKERSKLTNMIETAKREANYLLRERSETDALYKLIFTLNSEHRDKEVQCWENVFDLLKEFLIVWDAYEQARSRTSLLDLV